MSSSKALPAIKLKSKRHHYEGEYRMAPPMTMDSKITNAKLGEVASGRARLKSGLRKKAST